MLGLIFGQPERSFYATELIGLTGAGSGAMQRELARLAQSGLVTVRPVGNQKHYQANPDAPIYAELPQQDIYLVRFETGEDKTLGVPIGCLLEELVGSA